MKITVKGPPAETVVIPVHNTKLLFQQLKELATKYNIRVFLTPALDRNEQIEYLASRTHADR